MSILDKIIGTHSQRELKRINGTVDKIESLRTQMQALSDEELKSKLFARLDCLMDIRNLFEV